MPFAERTSGLPRGGRRATVVAGFAIALAASAASPGHANGQPTPVASPVAAVDGAVAAAVDEAVDDAEALAVARSLNCPICEGRNLVDCPLPVCAEMRAEIRARLAAGDDRAAIVQHFVDYYGPAVRNTPPLTGPLALAWWVPLALLVGGAWLVARLVTARATQATAAGESRAAGGASGPIGSAGVDVRPRATAGAVDTTYAERIERMAAERDEGQPR